MAPYPFCCGMHNDIRSPLKWLGDIWCCKCVVDDKRNVIFMGNLRHGFNIEYIKAWIRDDFTVYCFGAVGDGCFYVCWICVVYERDMGGILLQFVCEEDLGSPVVVGIRDYFIT